MKYKKDTITTDDGVYIHEDDVKDLMVHATLESFKKSKMTEEQLKEWLVTKKLPSFASILEKCSEKRKTR